MTTVGPRTSDHEIEPMFLERWSPRAYSGEAIPEAELMQILEAARWAPSSYNSQPWRFIYARRDTPHWEPMLSLLNDGNRSWAKEAAVLMVLVSSSLMTVPGQDKPVPSHSHSLDAGSAWGYLALQAAKLDWHAHAMVGFDMQRAPRPLECPDEFQHTFVGDPPGDPGHVAIVVDSIEEFLEVEVNHDIVTFGNVALRLGHRLMGRASGSESVAMLRKRCVPLLLQDLQHGLLDQSVDDARYAEFPDPTVRLGYFDPLDRLWLVGSVEQLRPYAWPVLPQVVLGVVDGHPIHASTALVPSHASPRTLEILSVAHLLHELFRYSRAFGRWLRREWFGPRRSDVRGFTPTFRFQGQ